MEKPESKKKMSWLRRRLRLLGLFIVLALEIVYLLLHATEWANAPMVRRLLLKRLLRTFWASATIEDSRLELRKQTAHVYEPRVYNSEGVQVAEADYVRVRMNLMALLWRVIKIAEVEIENPEVYMWTDKDSVFMWDRFKKPGKRNRLTDTRVDTVIVHNGRYTYDYFPDKMPLHVEVEGVNGHAEFVEKTGTVDATAEKLLLRFPGFDHYFHHIKAKGIVDKDFVEAERIDATFLGMPIVIKGTLTGFKTKSPRMDFTVDATGSIGQLLKYFDYNKDPPGPFTLHAHVTGRTSEYRVSGTFRSDWGVVEGQQYSDARAEYVYTSSDKTVRLGSFSVRVFDMNISGSGRYNIGNNRFAATGRIKTKYRLLNYDIAGWVDTRNSVIHLERINLWTPYVRLSGDGSWSIKKGYHDYDWRMDMNNMARELPYWGIEDIGGSLKLNGMFQGDITNPTISGHGMGYNLVWMDFQLGNGPVSIELDNGMLVLDMEAKRGAEKVSGSLEFPFLENGDFTNLDRVQTKWTLDVYNREFPPEFFDTDLYFRLNAHIDGGGGFDDLTGDGTVTLMDGKAWGQEVKTVEGRVHLSSEGLSLGNVVLTLPSGDRADGWLKFDWDLNYEFEMVSEELFLESLNAVTEAERPVSGSARINIEGEGNFRDPRVWGDVEFVTLNFDKLIIEGVVLSFSLAGSVVSVNGSQEWGITFVGDYDLATGAFHNFYMYFNHFDLAPICEYACVRDLTGHITGRLILNGGEKGWDDVDYNVHLTELDIVYMDVPLQNKGDIRLAIGPHGGEQYAHIVSEYGRVQIEGTISPAQVWDIYIEADLELEFVAKLVDQIKYSTGSLTVNMRIYGPSENLGYSGAVSLKGGSLRLRGYYAEIRNISGEAGFTPESFHLDRFEGAVGDEGVFSAFGDLKLRNFEVVGFAVTAKGEKIPIRSHNTYKAYINPNLTLEGNLDKPRLSGEIVMSEGLYYKDVQIRRQIIEVKRETTPRSEVPDWIRNLEFDVAISDRGYFRIENNLTNTPLRINLTVRGTPAQPEVDGEIEAAGGKIFYAGNAFDIVRGRLDFADKLKIDPLVDVFATTRVREYEIRLYLEGVLSHMVLRLESSPELDDQNILALITFGKTMDELTEGEQQSLVNLSLLFSQDVAQAVGTPLENFTGLDIFTVEASEETAGTKVTVGKKISKRIEIEYSSDMGGEAPIQETRLIYKLTDNIWLQGSQNSLGIYSFRINFHFLLQ